MPAEIMTAAATGLSALDLSKSDSHSTQSQFSDTSSDHVLDSLMQAEMTSPNNPEDDAEGKTSITKKKKKKRSKKAASAKSKPNGAEALPDDASVCAARPPVLCISRNKHWKYISSYHGPWLQLPLELLESLLVLNLDPATVSASDMRMPTSPMPSPAQYAQPTGFARLRERSGSSISLSSSTSHSYSPPASPAGAGPPQPLPPLVLRPGAAAPPPIDPGVFRSVAAIRRLIDEAAELSVRASSGLSAAALGSLRGGGGGGGFGFGGSPWAAAQSLGLNPMGDFGGGGGRNVPMSATRVHRLRALAVQKLAEAYKADEIASSVMVMGRGTVFDDIAERVLKVDPKNADARYVHFFHEKIPSRQLAESTSTNTLDQLIAENPQRLEFYRTRGIVHCFRDEFALATKDFTYALKESRAVRRARQAHDPALRSNGDSHSKAKRKKAKVNGQAPPSGTAPVIEGPDGEQLLIHPSVLPDAPEPLEPQVLFHRGAAYLAHAFFLIEEAFFALEEIPRIPPNDFGEVHLSYVTHGRYGGTEIGNPDGPLGRADGAKARAYRAAFGEGQLREQVCTLLRKSKRDHEKFLAHFDTLELEAPPDAEDFGDGDVLHRMERAFALLETFRPNSRQHDAPTLAQDVALPFTTYHPLLLEAHFSILNCLLMLGEFAALTHTFGRSACVVAGLEGYPVFLPPRSMAQAEFVETLERLAGGWRYGRLPNALVRAGARRFAEPVVRRTPSPLPVAEEDDPAAAACPSAGPSTASSSSKTPSASGRGSPVSDAADTEGGDVRGALEHLRALLAPVHARLRAKAERERAVSEQARGARAENARAPLSLALHGARVEVILAWLGAVHLPALEAAAAA